MLIDSHLDIDLKEINLQKSWNVSYWCEELSLRAEDLKEIVSAVGPSVHEVRVFLAKKLLRNGFAPIN